MRALVFASCLALAGCAGLSARVAGWTWQAEPIIAQEPTEAPSAPSRKPDRIERAAKATDTPTSDILTALDAWNGALDLFEVKAPRPNLRIVSANHWMIRGGTRAAVAARFEDGSDALYINQAWLVSAPDLTETLQHEAAHIKAWREHGEAISEHGTHWQSVCISYATRADACRATTFERFK